jgi:hypothetical protein
MSLIISLDDLLVEIEIKPKIVSPNSKTILSLSLELFILFKGSSLLLFFLLFLLLILSQYLLWLLLFDLLFIFFDKIHEYGGTSFSSRLFFFILPLDHVGKLERQLSVVSVVLSIISQVELLQCILLGVNQ